MEQNQYQDNFDINEIVKVETLPKIFEQLEIISEFVDKQLEGVEELECTEQNKTDVKNKRTLINNTINIMETKRKDIKKEIMKNYDIFNEKYESKVKTKLENASLKLKEKIDKIESEQRQKGTTNLKNFANEYFIKYQIQDIVTFDDIKLNITLTGLGKNLEGTSYKKDIIDFCEKVANDLKLIELEEYKDEIMIEYKQTLDFTNSKLNVTTRHKLLEQEQQRREALEKQLNEQKQVIEKVEEITAPKEIVQEEIIEVQFKVKGTLNQIKELKEFLIKNKYNYK